MKYRYEPRPLLSVTIPLLAMAQGSKTPIVRGGRVFLLDGTGGSKGRHAAFKKYRNTVSDYMRMEARRQRVVDFPLDDAAVVDIVCSFPRPKKHRRANGDVKPRYLSEAKRTTPDLDKLARSIMDAGTGVLWSDDAIVVGSNLRKRYADHPSIEIKVYAACWCGLPGPCVDCVADAVLP